MQSGLCGPSNELSFRREAHNHENGCDTGFDLSSVLAHANDCEMADSQSGAKGVVVGGDWTDRLVVFCRASAVIPTVTIPGIPILAQRL